MNGREAGNTAMSRAPLRIVMMSDGIAGHYRQSEGIVAALARSQSVELIRIELPKRTGAFRFFTALATRLGLTLPLSWHMPVSAIPAGPVDLIVSSGGRTLPANVGLAQRLKTANIFSGSPRQFPVSAFSGVFLSYPAPEAKGHYILKPTALDPDTLAAPRRRQDTDVAHPFRIAVLIGGPTKPCPWSENDWKRILLLTASIAADPALRLVAVTSRRTPSAWADELIGKTAGLPGLEQIVDYRTAGPGSISVAYGCDAMIVSGDSMSMVTEAVAARRPVLVLMPESRQTSRDDATMDDLAARNLISLLPVAGIDMASALKAIDTRQPMTGNHLDHLAEAVLAVIGKPAH